VPDRVEGLGYVQKSCDCGHSAETHVKALADALGKAKEMVRSLMAGAEAALVMGEDLPMTKMVIESLCHDPFEELSERVKKSDWTMVAWVSSVFERFGEENDMRDLPLLRKVADVEGAIEDVERASEKLIARLLEHEIEDLVRARRLIG